MERYFCLVVPLDNEIEWEVVLLPLYRLARMFVGCVGVQAVWTDPNALAVRFLFLTHDDAVAAQTHFANVGGAYVKFSEN